jgi:enediyne biosynthesis protein E4
MLPHFWFKEVPDNYQMHQSGRYILLTILVLTAWACEERPHTLFTRLSSKETGVTFRNLLIETDPSFNIIFYPYFYNGGGVAVGDLNNDGLTDIFFTGNMVKNRLFLNKGGFEFEDITVSSGVAEKEGWCTGATMADVNEDGWLDIYVCRSALDNVNFRKNLLFINNGDLTFTESASTYGLDDPGYSTQASFFDYDLDGDLDVFLINQSTPEFSKGQIDYIQNRYKKLPSGLENKLFRNDNKKFFNVTAEAGITSNVFTYSLGVNTTDINQDGFPDIYVANDFKEADYYYLNNGDGTFTNVMERTMQHNSLYSMGVDVADYNNDLLPDVMVADMLAEGNFAQKMHMGGDNYTQYRHLFANGMFPQFMKNCLQKNNGNGTFSEIAQLSGVSNTDWSWSPLFADYDNDGRKDLFITNGYKRDNTDIQFIVYSMNQSMRIQEGGAAVNVAEYISHMPGISLPNYAYKNIGNDQFVNKIKEWGLDHATFSHGAAYADLDNDGDLDLITNNTDDYAGVYRNNNELLANNNFLAINLEGDSGNIFGIGTKIYLYAGKERKYLEQNPVRGYQSSSDFKLHFGLGEIKIIDSLRIVWPGNIEQTLYNVSANSTLNLTIADTEAKSEAKSPLQTYFESTNQMEFRHIENDANDFLRQFLLPHFFSHNGPSMASSDIDQDGITDIYIGGARGQEGSLFLGQSDGGFRRKSLGTFQQHKHSEDVDATFFDADGDDDQDLYVVSGGYEFEPADALLNDRIYINDGHGNFSYDEGRLPMLNFNKRCVASGDADGDGDIDLFLGGGFVPGRYPIAEESRILLNSGNGYFSIAPDYFFSMKASGSVNDAVWVDINRDSIPELVAAGEWTDIKIYRNTGSGLVDQSRYFLNVNRSGWWNTILAEDFDGDGDKDIIVGNYGHNSQLHVSTATPLQIHYDDFDQNGSIDPILSHFIQGKSVPLIPRDDLIGQIPSMKKKFPSYEPYADATVAEILSPEQISKATVLSVSEMSTIYLENRNNVFVLRDLPAEAQYAPVHAMFAVDINQDGYMDLIAAGNNKYNRIYLGRHDANNGFVFLNNGRGNFDYVPQYRSGLNINGDVRSIVQSNETLLFGINNDEVRGYRLRMNSAVPIVASSK